MATFKIDQRVKVVRADGNNPDFKQVIGMTGRIVAINPTLAGFNGNKPVGDYRMTLDQLPGHHAIVMASEIEPLVDDGIVSTWEEVKELINVDDVEAAAMVKTGVDRVMEKMA